MLYSKYHGILLVFFTLLSNPALFKKYQTYIVAVVAILLFIPHLYWQYAHHFPSIQFHLFERNAARYNFSFTSEFILVQIALAGPLLGWLFLWAAFSGKPITLTERAMKFSMIGIYLVFLVSTLKGRAEANWTVPAFVSLIVLSHQFLFDKPSIRKWVFRLAPVTVLLVFITRIYMMLDIVPSTTVSKDEFHENKMAASAILQKANGLPVVFVNSYQKPSKYWFYTGKKAFALNTPGYRRNNFNYWPVEDSIIGRPVYAVGARSDLFRDSIPGNRYMENGGYRIDNYFSFSKVQITNIREELITKDLIQLTCIILAPEHYLPYFQLQPFDRAAVVMAVYDRWGDVAEYLTSSFTLKQLNEARTVTTISARHSLPAANYTIKLGIVSCIAGFPSLNSSAIKIVVK